MFRLLPGIKKTSKPNKCCFSGFARHYSLALSDSTKVYLQFPGTREKLQGCSLEVLNLFFAQFSVNFPDEISRKNRLNNRIRHLWTWIPDFRAFQLVPGRIFDVASELEVRFAGFWHPGAKI